MTRRPLYCIDHSWQIKYQKECWQSTFQILFQTIFHRKFSNPSKYLVDHWINIQAFLEQFPDPFPKYVNRLVQLKYLHAKEKQDEKGQQNWCQLIFAIKRNHRKLSFFSFLYYLFYLYNYLFNFSFYALILPVLALPSQFPQPDCGEPVLWG